MRKRLILAVALALGACAGEEDPTAAGASSTQERAPAPAAARPRTEPVIPITEVEPELTVIAEEVAYGATEHHNLNGYLALPADLVDVPAVIMIHEWWGLDDGIRAMARRLAGEGYAVLAIDLFGGSTAATSAEADRLVASVMGEREAVIDNIRQAHGYLDQFLLAPRIALLGWGLGGGWSLEAGIELADGVDAVVSYYGRITTSESLLSSLDAPFLGVFAQHDESVPLRDVQQMRGRLQDLGKTARIEIYLSVDHAFMNPASRTYDHSTAEEAWDLSLAFLDEHFR